MIQDVSLQFASQSCHVSGRSFSRRSSANEEARLCPRWTSDFGEDTSEWVMGVTRPVENLRALPKNAPSTHHASQGRGEGDYSKPAPWWLRGAVSMRSTGVTREPSSGRVWPSDWVRRILGVNRIRQFTWEGPRPADGDGKPSSGINYAPTWHQETTNAADVN